MSRENRTISPGERENVPKNAAREKESGPCSVQSALRICARLGSGYFERLSQFVGTIRLIRMSKNAVLIAVVDAGSYR
jgi:hypothetical protein